MKFILIMIGLIVLGIVVFTVPKAQFSQTTSLSSGEGEIKTMSTQNQQENDPVKLTVTMNDQTYTVTMFDNPAVDELIEQLPMTLKFSDYNGQEKGSKAPQPLTTQGLPASDRGHLNDFVYYAPSNSLVFCYTDIGSWSGIVRLGTFDQDIKNIESLPDEFEVTIQKAN